MCDLVLPALSRRSLLLGSAAALLLPLEFVTQIVVEDEQEVFLKTIIPSRKATKKYLKGNEK